jgi:hypothetical protein
MQKFNARITDVDFVYSEKKGKRSASDSHGGFDNDPATMNDVLKRVLGKPPAVPFTDKNLDY